MVRATVGGLLLLACTAATPAALAASFDCAQARSPVERLICADPALSALDDRLAEAWRAAVAEGRATPELRAAQRAWVAERDRCAAARACVAAAYERRLGELAGGEVAPAATETASAPPDAGTGGKYCVFGRGNAVTGLQVRPLPGDGLRYVVWSWGENGHYFGLGGDARRAGDGWRHVARMDPPEPPARCTVTLRRGGDGGWRVAFDDAERCAPFGGHNAIHYVHDVFPPASRVGDAPAGAAAWSEAEVACARPGRGRRAR